MQLILGHGVPGRIRPILQAATSNDLGHVLDEHSLASCIGEGDDLEVWVNLCDLLQPLHARAAWLEGVFAEGFRLNARRRASAAATTTAAAAAVVTPVAVGGGHSNFARSSCSPCTPRPPSNRWTIFSGGGDTSHNFGPSQSLKTVNKAMSRQEKFATADAWSSVW